MSIETAELIQVCEQLPDAQRGEVADFARFLLSKRDDAAWERTIADPRRRPKLDAFLEESIREPSEPLNPKRS